MPKTINENKFYGKDNEYDKGIKDKIIRSDSLIQKGTTDYTNGNVQVIIPYNEAKISS